MSGASKGGISIKTKIFAVLAVALMMAAAFVGVASTLGSNDSDADGLTINEASGTVNYIPDAINVSEGGNVTFSPTVNWADITYNDDYDVEITYLVSSAQDGTYSSNLTVTTTNQTYVVEVSSNTITVTGVEGVTGSATANSFWVEAVVEISYNDVVIANRSTVEDVNVYVYTDVSIINTLDCHFGEVVSSSIVSNGSTDYAVTISDSELYDDVVIISLGVATITSVYNGSTELTITNSVGTVDSSHYYVADGYLVLSDVGTYTVNVGSSSYIVEDGTTSGALVVTFALPEGLYLLGNTLAGYATIDVFDNEKYVVLATAVDEKTGTAVQKLITINTSVYSVSVSISDVVFADGTTSSKTIHADGVVYVNESTIPAEVVITFANVVTNYQESNVIAMVDGQSNPLTENNDSYTFSVSMCVTGTHVCIIDYEVDGHSYTFTFYIIVIENGTVFVVPDPNIEISVTG